MLKFFRRLKGNDNDPKDPTEEQANSSTSPTAPLQEEPSSLKSPAEGEEITPSLSNESHEAKEISWFGRLTSSLTRTRTKFTEGLANLFLGRKVIDEELLEEIETHLLTADVGIEATKRIIETLTRGISRKELNDPTAVFNALQKALTAILTPCEYPLSLTPTSQPYVILMVGVNGAGKTTTIGKLAKKFQQAGRKVMLAAGDTFRAAAVEQLQVWGERNQVPVVAQHTGADSASVIFDAFQSAKAKGIDILIADTAGRLHTRENLMDELKKVKRVIQKLDPTAPHEIMLVLDAGTGQNALVQAQKFHEALGVTGITLTKLDGTAKGGIIFAIADSLKLPIRFIGVGEKIDDLRSFEAQSFVSALFNTTGGEEM